MFAAWEDEAALEAWLQTARLGQTVAEGWHVRLRFLRRWGALQALEGLPRTAEATDPQHPVVAITIARMRLLQIPRFLRWGRPVEAFVRDHPGVGLALAATRPVRTICTFTIWETAQQMTDMVHGRSSLPAPRIHADAMVERHRKPFHTEFTTMRYACVGEFGSWEGRGDYVRALPEEQIPAGEAGPHGAVFS